MSKAMPPGTVQQWADGPHQKQGDGRWSPVTTGGDAKEQYLRAHRAKRDSEKGRLKFLAGSVPGQRDIDGEEISDEHIAAARRRLTEIEAEESKEARSEGARQAALGRREAARQVSLFDEAPRAPKVGQASLFTDRQIDETKLDQPRKSGGQAMLFSERPKILVPARRS
jgi:hypothetical protein